jgi:hypothetical protein
VRTLRGTSADVDGRVVAVRLAVSRRRGDDCATLTRGGRWRPGRRCRPRFVLVAKGPDPWSLRLPLRRGLRPGRYTIAVRATDDDGMHQQQETRRLLRVRRGR